MSRRVVRAPADATAHTTQRSDGRLRRRSAYLVLVGVAQLSAFLAGVLLIRSMPKGDYAAYAAAVAGISAAAVIADSGIGATLMARMAAVGGALGERHALMRAALAVRRRVAVVVLVPICVGVVVVFVGLHLAPIVIVICVALVAVVVWNSLVRTLYVVDLQLQRRFVPIVAADASAGVFRLALVAIVALIGLGAGTATPVYLAIFLAASFLQTSVARRFSGFRSSTAGDASAYGPAFTAAFRTTAPWTVLLIAGEQLINLLLTSYGNAAAIAEISALTRYALLLQLVVSVAGNVVGATLAHVAPTSRALGSAFRRLVGGGALISAGFVGGVWIMRLPLLDLLGPGYAHLDTMFLLLAVASALQFFGTYVLGAMTHARGWLRGSWTFGPFLAAWVLAVVLVLQPRDSITAALAFLCLQIPTLLVQVVRVILGFRGVGAAAVP